MTTKRQRIKTDGTFPLGYHSVRLTSRGDCINIGLSEDGAALANVEKLGNWTFDQADILSRVEVDGRFPSWVSAARAGGVRFASLTSGNWYDPVPA
jgi:hypothetical protein